MGVRAPELAARLGGGTEVILDAEVQFHAAGTEPGCDARPGRPEAWHNHRHDYPDRPGSRLLARRVGVG